MNDLAFEFGSALLPLLVALPTLGAILLTLVPRENEAVHRGIGLAFSLLTFVASIPLLTGFDPSVGGFQAAFDFRAEWIPSIGATFSLQLDGISLWVVMLTTFLTPIILLASKSSIGSRVREFIIAMLLLETAMIGALVATDLLLFYLFWEMMLIPMYLLIGIWGGPNRHYATIKFVVYTVTGSLLMLVALIYLYTLAGSFAYADILALNNQLSLTEQMWLFGAFALAFSIKVPVFPFHTWLPDAHTEAPTAGSVVLASILLKMGTYGLLRFAMPLFPEAMGVMSPYIFVLAVTGIIYGAVVAYAQNDVKKLIAYSSVAHLGFVMLGIVVFNQQAVEGAIIQMINHGVSTGALFLLIGMVYDRTHTRAMDDYGGIAKQMPIFMAIFIIVTMSSIGLPGTNGFVGEFLILAGAFEGALPMYPTSSWTTLSIVGAIISTFGVLLAAIYLLFLVRRVFFGPLNPRYEKSVADGGAGRLKDLNFREVSVLLPLLALIFIMGFAPVPFTSRTTAAVENLLQQTAPRIESVRNPRAQAASLEDTDGDAHRLSFVEHIPTAEVD